MTLGKVKWFNPTKGYGFIQPDDGGQDVFVHVSSLASSGLHSLNEGDRVSYKLNENKGRTSASDIQIES